MQKKKTIFIGSTPLKSTIFFYYCIVSKEIPLPSANQNQANIKLFEDDQKAAHASMLLQKQLVPGQPSNLFHHLCNVNTAYL